MVGVGEALVEWPSAAAAAAPSAEEVGLETVAAEEAA